MVTSDLAENLAENKNFLKNAKEVILRREGSLLTTIDTVLVGLVSFLEYTESDVVRVHICPGIKAVIQKETEAFHYMGCENNGNINQFTSLRKLIICEHYSSLS